MIVNLVKNSSKRVRVNRNKSTLLMQKRKCFNRIIDKKNFKNNNLKRFSNNFVRFYSEKLENETISKEENKEEVKDEIDEEGAKETPNVLIAEDEKTIGDSEKNEFQAETRKILDIVTRSIYTEKEVYIRELISNASDALEKARTKQAVQPLQDSELPFEIKISVDPVKKTFTIQDYGIGMTKDELKQYLGNIGFSGTAEYVKLLEDKVKSKEYIGQFGVGFYSAFMVASRVKVYSKSAIDGEGHVWESDGMGSYKINQADGVKRGTKIILYLKDNCDEYSQFATIEDIIKKYSNFVGFDISLNGKKVNTVRALWLEDKNKITPEEHKAFYQFIAKAFDSPAYNIQFSTDSPLSIRALLYVPEYHTEKYGMGIIEPGVSIYCRKVLIQTKSKDLLPEWLRFIRGVVDSEDIPLNISREHLQDSSLIKRLGNVITTRLIKFFDSESKKDPEKYKKFHEEYSYFMKQGVCADAVHKTEIAGLLRFESSKESYTSLHEYVQRMPQTQSEIYYLMAPSRAHAESSPYFESFKEEGIEVLFLYQDMDDFVMNNLGDYSGKKLVSIESSNVNIKKKKDDTSKALEKEAFLDFSKWFKDVLSDKVVSVKESERILSTPCIIIDAESASYRRIMQMMQNKKGHSAKQQVEINSSHPVILKLNSLRSENEEKAKMFAEQIFDNALMQAGLLDDGRTMVPRINRLMDIALGITSSTTNTNEQVQQEQQEEIKKD